MRQFDTSSFDWDAQVSLKRLIESAPIAIVVVGGQGQILYVNAKLEELFGYSRAELLGQVVEVLLPARFRVRHTQHRSYYVQHPHQRSMGSGMDLAGQRKDGAEFPLEAGLSSIQIDGETVVITTLTDISRRKEVETLLEQRVEERTREIERRQQVADGLRHIMAMLNSNHPLAEVLDRIVTQAMHLLGVGACAIFRSQAREGCLVMQVSCGFTSPDLMNATLPLNEEHVAGIVALRGQPVVIPDLQQAAPASMPAFEPRRQLLVANGYRALLAVPLVIKDEVNGSFVLYSTSERIFTEEEIELASTSSNQAALAIENERLRTQIERSAVAAERNRIARDLHDAVTQTLFSASMIADVLPRILRRNQDEAVRRLEELRELTRGALAEMRTLLLELRPAKLLEIDLADLLRQLAEAVAGRARVPVTVQIEGDTDIPADVKVALYRIAQEALNNVAKHAQAHHAQIKLVRDAEFIDLAVADDGCGFVFERIAPQHLGLGIMRERAEDIGATLTVQSQPNQGTRVVVRWAKERGARSEGRGVGSELHPSPLATRNP
jgi:PAS domain S-box-containing protein